jgi:glucuronokinase
VQSVVGRALARIGLLGNPSDGYEGCAIAATVRGFDATVEIEPAEHFELVAGSDDRLVFDDLRELSQVLHTRGSYGGLRLMRAALARFTRHQPIDDCAAERLRFRMTYRTDIPRQVGLSGSSALVIAALRALGEWFEAALPPGELAEMALAAEVEELGIAAGPMDRVIQAFEGVMFMDFAPPRSESAYERLDPDSLPPLFMAWDPQPGIDSGRLHGGVRERWLAGEPEVRRVMQELRALTADGRKCLEAGDRDGFVNHMDENFDLRAAIFPMRRRDRELVEIGRGAGAAVKFAGSGGAVVGAVTDPGELDRVLAAYRDAAVPACIPEIGAA